MLQKASMCSRVRALIANSRPGLPIEQPGDDDGDRAGDMNPERE